MSTIQDIQSSIETEVSIQVPSLTSTSKTAIWKLWSFIVASAHYTLYQMWEIAKKEFDNIAASRAAGTPLWLADKVMAFQYGFAITVIDYNASYLDTTSTAAVNSRIIKYVAINEANGTVLIKVAKDDSGELVKLGVGELISLTSYVNKIKFAGIATSVISLDPDRVKLQAQIYYDGQYTESDISASVEDAILNYMKGISFDGKFNKNKLIDSIQAITGVNDIVIMNLLIRPNSGSFLSVVKDYSPASGYYGIDADFPLSSNLTYIAQ